MTWTDLSEEALRAELESLLGRPIYLVGKEFDRLCWLANRLNVRLIFKDVQRIPLNPSPVAVAPSRPTKRASRTAAMTARTRTLSRSVRRRGINTPPATQTPGGKDGGTDE